MVACKIAFLNQQTAVPWLWINFQSQSSDLSHYFFAILPYRSNIPNKKKEEKKRAQINCDVIFFIVSNLLRTSVLRVIALCATRICNNIRGMFFKFRLNKVRCYIQLQELIYGALSVKRPYKWLNTSTFPSSCLATTSKTGGLSHFSKPLF